MRTASEGLLRFTDKPSDFEVPDNFVKAHASEWSQAIGEWTFERVSPIPSPSSTRALQVTNEVRLPTPRETPQGSTKDLLETETR